MTITDIRAAIADHSDLFSDSELECIRGVLSKAALRESLRAKAREHSDKDLALKLKDDGNRKFRDGKYLEAVECYTKAISEDPVNEILYSNRAAAYAMLGLDENGIEDCNVAITLNPGFAKCFIRLGDFYYGKDAAKSKKYYEEAISIEPGNERASKKLERLNGLDGKPSVGAADATGLDALNLDGLFKNEKVMNMMKSESFQKLVGEIASGRVDMSSLARKIGEDGAEGSQ